jgi:hypothetical protein
MNNTESKRLMKIPGIRNKFFFVLIAVSLAGLPGRAFSLHGQASGAGDERVFVHTNKPAYVAGEMLRFRVFTFDNRTRNISLKSRIMYFVLTDYKGNTALQWRINLKKKDNSGSCKLPSDLPGGVYTLTAYTSRMRNDPYETLGSENILVSSLSHEFPDTLYIPLLKRQEAFSQAFPESKPDILVETKSEYHPGDTAETVITLNKELTGDTASVSVSVNLSVPLVKIMINDSLLKLKRYSGGKEGSGGELSGSDFPLEDRSYMLTGTLKSRTTNAPISGGRIILAVIDSLFPHIRYSRTDSTGRFHFYLDRWFDNREIILQNGGTAVEGGVVWEIDRKKLAVLRSPYIPYTVHQEESNSVATLNESRLVESVYGEKVPALPAEAIPPGTNYFGPPDMSVKPADYSDLVNLKEISENILPGVRFGSKGTTFAIQVFNVRTGQWPESKLILLNGVPFYDMNYIATLGTKDIRRIEVIGGNYLLGDLTLEGLVSIYTNDHKIPESYLKNRSFIFQNTVVPSDEPAKSIVADRADAVTSHDPDFRVNLLWDPAREITGGQKLVIRFPVSLITGTYDIAVNGLTRKGTVLSGKTSFEVK